MNSYVEPKARKIRLRIHRRGILGIWGSFRRFMGNVWRHISPKEASQRNVAKKPVDNVRKPDPNLAARINAKKRTEATHA